MSTALADRRIRALGWTSLVLQVLIVATGSAVRLTGSGLGCPTWPLCTSDSLVSTPEMGLHGVIEFGNRTLSVAVGIVALVVLIALYRWRRDRHVLVLLAWVVLMGVTVQALVGGITVLTGLNPFIVGFHYVASITLVVVATAFVVLERPAPPAAEAPGVTPALRTLVLVLAGAAAVTIVLGVLTTGAGPHSGDPDAGRNGFDAEILSHLHAVPSYVLLAASVALVVVAVVRAAPRSVRRGAAAVLAVVLAQIGVGLFQANAGLPALAVGVHLVLAAVLASVVTSVVLAVMRPPAAAESAAVTGAPPDTSESGAVEVELVVAGESVVPFAEAVRLLTEAYDDVPAVEVRGILLHEWSAFSGGIPAVVPRAVIAGVVERLDASPGPSPDASHPPSRRG